MGASRSSPRSSSTRPSSTGSSQSATASTSASHARRRLRRASATPVRSDAASDSRCRPSSKTSSRALTARPCPSISPARLSLCSSPLASPAAPRPSSAGSCRRSSSDVRCEAVAELADGRRSRQEPRSDEGRRAQDVPLRSGQAARGRRVIALDLLAHRPPVHSRLVRSATALRRVESGPTRSRR